MTKAMLCVPYVNASTCTGTLQPDSCPLLPHWGSHHFLALLPGHYLAWEAVDLTFWSKCAQQVPLHHTE